MTHKEINVKVCPICGFRKKLLVLTGEDKAKYGAAYDEIGEGKLLCKRCWRYYMLTGQVKHAEGWELRNAKNARKMMLLMKAVFEEYKMRIDDDWFKEAEGIARNILNNHSQL